MIANLNARRIIGKTLARVQGDVRDGAALQACHANPALVRSLLGWTAERTLQQMCADAWRWQGSNPQGYGDKGRCPTHNLVGDYAPD